MGLFSKPVVQNLSRHSAVNKYICMLQIWFSSTAGNVMPQYRSSLFWVPSLIVCFFVVLIISWLVVTVSSQPQRLIGTLRQRLKQIKDGKAIGVNWLGHKGLLFNSVFSYSS